ncbi:MAG TPA: glutamate--tRNA ligase [Thermomicrobiales bacterium]|nr:glutamate--tRNA ligase [Thermomicrobiales bacterium]
MTDTAPAASPGTPTLAPDAPVVRVRFAPSPTGSLHVGGGRTVLFNWLFAHGQAAREGKRGAFILRIEDTDQKRYVPEAVQGILDILTWFGVSWEEGPDQGGPFGPYTQSERTELYRAHAEQLVTSGHAYHCFCTPERLAQVREEQRARGEAPGYDRHCRWLPAEEVRARLAAGEPSVIRFAMPRDGETRVYDLIRGEIVYQNANLEDLILLKSDGYPTYHLANVVDDHLMAITHIMRGDEWIPTAPLHVRLYAAFGWDVPILAHMPLILAPGGGKLSKRHGSTAMEEFRAQGYLPEALMNYLALLGWSFDATTEIFSKEDLLEKFTLERVSPSPATFDYKKLLWFNQYYINHILDLDDLTARVVPFLAAAGLVDPAAADPSHPDFARVRAATALLKDRLETLAEAPDLMAYFLRDDLDPYDPALLVPKKTEPAAVLDALVAVQEVLDATDVADEAEVEAKLRALADERGLKAGQIFMPIRVAVTGRDKSPGLFETLRVIGNERVRTRLAAAIELLRGQTGETVGGD